jgi:3'-phosphoadenosine 5'-phosphosulfate sulfotransferase (PAPS reductase)/FAD synthetase
MKPLGRKQTSTHEDWVEVMANIEKVVSKQEMDNLLDKAVEDVKKKTKGKKTAFAWSGGKDSIALEGVMKLAGVEECLMGMSNLEYPAFLQWVTDYMPDGLEIIINEKLDLPWLAKNQHMLFPPNSTVASKWFKAIQHNAQDKYFQKHKLDVVILGRRKADGNHVGGKGENIYTNGKGITRFSPISDWTHEHILAYVHYYYKNPLPPFYNWPRGYRCGTHSWAARQWTQGIMDGWREVYIIDKNIVHEASRYIPSAKQFLERAGKI